MIVGILEVINTEPYSTVTNVTSTSSYLLINPIFGLSTTNPRVHQYIRKEDPQNNQIRHSEERAFISLQKDLPSASPEEELQRPSVQRIRLVALFYSLHHHEAQSVPSMLISINRSS
ncbi:hypothetical protein L5515_010629 [Caenorhabditis briggsae]|uniref:Uncharacterized protein n=1 Tax=Caenorhabditis briggsae TaxID=6238 RepID=A0AAE9ET70_CAEBR|nr:hypothetical protein L5515_010629 [Caenorhabditis briggsae]